MDENQNPTPLPTEAPAKEGPVSQVPNTTPPVIPHSPARRSGGIRDPESPNSKPSKKFSLKLIIGIIVFLVLAGGAAASYVYKDQLVSLVSKPTPAGQSPLGGAQPSISPTPDPTADWKTFSTSTYSFKYPADKFKIEEREKNYFALVPIGEISGFAGIFIDSRKTNYDETIADIREQLVNPTITSIPSGEIVSGVIGPSKTEGMSLEGTSVKVAIIRNNDQSIYISAMGTQTKDNSFTFFEQILSTFKFTDSQTVDTSNWKTYKNSEYLYSIKYPKDWVIDVAGDANPETFPSPYINSFCDYQKGTLCSQINIGVSEPKDKTDLIPDFIIDSPGDKIYDKSQIMLDGEKASEFDWFDSGYYNKGRLMHVVVTQKNKNKYTITYEESQKNQLFRIPKDWKDRTTFDQILATFKFTE